MDSITIIKELIQKHKKDLRERYSVKTMGIFGSYARGDQSGKSDIDVLVEFDKPIGFFKFLELEEYLGEITGLKVDLVTKKALKPVIGKYILEDLVAI